MDTKIISDLQLLNLSLNEAKVYSALLEIGQTSAGNIIKKTGLHRSVVYETLDKLIGRKLVFKLRKSNITYFQPTDPQRLLENVKSQEEIVLDLVPKLQDLLKAKLPEITIYEGIESWRQFWFDMPKRLPMGTIDYTAGSLGAKWQEYMGGDKVIEKYIKLTVERKIRWKMIVYYKDPVELELLRNYPDLMEFRLIERIARSEGNFNIFGNESVILHSATEPMVIEVKNPTLVRVFQNIFDILWENGKPL